MCAPAAVWVSQTSDHFFRRTEHEVHVQASVIVHEDSAAEVGGRNSQTANPSEISAGTANAATAGAASHMHRSVTAGEQHQTHSRNGTAKVSQHRVGDTISPSRTPTASQSTSVSQSPTGSARQTSSRQEQTVGFLRETGQQCGLPETVANITTATHLKPVEATGVTRFTLDTSSTTSKGVMYHITVSPLRVCESAVVSIGGDVSFEPELAQMIELDSHPIEVSLTTFTSVDAPGTACVSASDAGRCRRVMRRLPLQFTADRVSLFATFVPDTSSQYYIISFRVWCAVGCSNCCAGWVLGHRDGRVRAGVFVCVALRADDEQANEMHAWSNTAGAAAHQQTCGITSRQRQHVQSRVCRPRGATADAATATITAMRPAVTLVSGTACDC